MNATSSATSSNATPPASTVARGFPDLPCVLCGAKGDVVINLADVTTCRCDQCGEEFDLEDARDAVARWSAVLAWIDTAPVIK